MRTMTLAESEDSVAAVSLGALFNGELGRYHESMSLDKIIWLTMRGGWPGALGLDAKNALEIPSHYIDETANKDMSKVDNRKRDSRKVRRLLYSRVTSNRFPSAVTSTSSEADSKTSVRWFSEKLLSGLSTGYSSEAR